MKKELLCLSVILVIFLVGCTEEADQAAIPDDMATEPEANPGLEEEKQAYSIEELAQHNTEDDCWVVYDGSIYDLTNTPMHPNMAKTFWEHCGDPTSFELAAKARHSSSDQARTSNYGEYVGELK